jgi:hypothetical protein
MMKHIRRVKCRHMPRADLRAARANRVFRTDEKHIRAKNTVMVSTNQAVGGLCKIADCVRMCFSSVHNRRSARTAFRPRKIEILKISADIGHHA